MKSMNNNRVFRNRICIVVIMALTLLLPQSAQAWITGEIDTDDFGDVVVTSYVQYDYDSRTSISNADDRDAFFDRVAEAGSGSWSEVILRCKARVLEIFVKSNFWQDESLQYNKFKKQNLVQYRTNTSKANNWKVGLSTDKEALFLDNPKFLITKIAKSKTLSIRYLLSDGTPQSATFDVRNLKEVRPSFAEAGCKI